MLSLIASAQTKVSYYDFNWKPCAAVDAIYYSILEKTDSGWFRKDYFVSTQKLQMQALFEDEACKIENGFSRYYYANGNLQRVGKEFHGKQEGICMSFYTNGMMSDSALFHDGHVVDKRFRWYRNGFMSDSISRENDSTDVQVGWFDDGSIAYAGYLVNGKEDGKWKYFHHNGKLSSVEIYHHGEMISAEYFNENGEVLTDTSLVNRDADFKGGIKEWSKYLGKNIYWPSNFEFNTSATVTVVVDFSIDENGKVADIEISLPFRPEFDQIAFKIIKNSPDWKPAIFHNRKVKVYRRQPITFRQID